MKLYSLEHPSMDVPSLMPESSCPSPSLESFPHFRIISTPSLVTLAWQNSKSKGVQPPTLVLLHPPQASIKVVVSMLPLEERVVASGREKKPIPSQQGEAEGRKEASLQSRCQEWWWDIRQVTIQEVTLLGITTVPSRKVMQGSQEAVTSLVDEMIAVEGQPFLMIKNVAFHQLL